MAICKYCGNEFNPSQVGRRKYCSAECAEAVKKATFQHYWETHKDKHREVCRKYQLEHADERDKRVHEFYEKHPDKKAEYAQNRKLSRATKKEPQLKLQKVDDESDLC